MSHFRERVEIGPHVLYLGDSIEILPSIDSVDAVVTDPPYAIPTCVARGRDDTRNVGDLTIVEHAMRAYLGAATSRLRGSGRVFVFCDGNFYPIVFRVLYSQFTTALLVWDKGQIGMGREFRKSHELIVHGWTSDTPIFSDGVGRPDVFRVAPVSGSARVHPAEKPEPLLTEILRVCGDVVLDPFMGSGTTGVACAKLGRRFIGVEIHEPYFRIACRRIADAVNGGVQPELFAGSAP